LSGNFPDNPESKKTRNIFSHSRFFLIKARRKNQNIFSGSFRKFFFLKNRKKNYFLKFSGTFFRTSHAATLNREESPFHPFTIEEPGPSASHRRKPSPPTVIRLHIMPQSQKGGKIEAHIMPFRASWKRLAGLFFRPAPIRFMHRPGPEIYPDPESSILALSG
jgi:hypothetical protein